MIALFATLLAVVTAPYAPVSYACDGATAAFTVNFPYLSSSDLTVTSTTAGGVVTILSSTTDFTTNVSSTQSTAVLTVLVPSTKCPSGSTLKIARSMALTQPQGFRQQTVFNPAIHEIALDRLEMQHQELSVLSPPILLANKGDLITKNSSGPTRFGTGVDGQVLSSDSTSPFGISWGAGTTFGGYVASGAGAVSRTFASKFSDVVSVKDFGAMGDGFTNDTSAFTNTIASIATNGGTVFVPCGTYALTSTITLTDKVSIIGASPRCATLAFSGATAGITVPAPSERFGIKDLTISTSNAAAGKAIDMSAGSVGSGLGYVFFSVRNVRVAATGSGRWSHGYYAAFAEVGEVVGLSVFQSATIGVYLADSSNQLSFYNLEVTGGNIADLTYNRGIWVDANPSGTGAPEFYGTTSQGCFSLGSAVFVSGHHPKFYGLHAEGTCTAADGGDYVVSGASDVNLYGGHVTQQIVFTGTIRGGLVSGLDAGGDVTMGSATQGVFIMNSRVATITDSGTVGSATNNGNGWIGCHNTSGGRLRDKGLVEFDAAGTGSASLAVNTATTSASYANNTTINWRQADGTDTRILSVDGTNNAVLAFPSTAGTGLIFRNSTPTNLLTLGNTALTTVAAVAIVANSTKNKGAITLSGGTGTATVSSGAVCTCADTTAANACKTSVSTTTLTITGTGTDIISYLCL